MAIFPGTEPVLKAAEYWKDTCLLESGSMFSGAKLWTLETFQELDALFIQNPDESKRSFMEKLEDQLAPGTPEARKLAAEVLWLLFLFPDQGAMKAELKRLYITRCWNWSDTTLDTTHDLLADHVLNGIGHPGIAFSSYRWKEFAYLVKLMESWFSTKDDKRRRVLSDPWEFSDWLNSQATDGYRQMPHILKHLLFPEFFERISGGKEKRKIIAAFENRPEAQGLELEQDRTVVDKSIYTLRKAMESSVGEKFDFYRPDLKQIWRAEEVSQSDTITVIPGEAEQWYAETFGDTRVWLMGAGEKARMWPEFRREEEIAIGMDDVLDDLSAYASKEEITDILIEARGTDANKPTMDALAAYEFSKVMRPGDTVIVKRGRGEILAIGRVESAYRYDADRLDFRHRRKVIWSKTGSWKIPRERWITNKTLTDFSNIKDWLLWLYRFIGETEQAGDDNTRAASSENAEEYGRENALEDLFLEPELFDEMLYLLRRKLNIILQGPPGVGKTFVARKLAYTIVGAKDSSRIATVQFHQSFAYEDFIQGFRPGEDGNFHRKNGVFYDFCEKARANSDNPYVFIIDEINRGNLSRIFGEVLVLLEADKRDPEYAASLTYATDEEEPFYIPQNLYIIGMMNTADRSLAMVDYALRRRFAFFDLLPAFGVESFEDFLTRNDVPAGLIARIQERLGDLNEIISADTSGLGPGYQVGHSFFCPAEDDTPDDEWYARVIQTEVAPLLREYWFDKPAEANKRIQALLQ